MKRCKNGCKTGRFRKWEIYTFFAFSHKWRLADWPNSHHALTSWWTTSTPKGLALLTRGKNFWPSKVDLKKRHENGHFSGVSQRNLKISRPANSLAIPLHWPFLPKPYLTTQKSARSKNAFSSETLKTPLFGHFGPPLKGPWGGRNPWKLPTPNFYG